LKCAAGDDKATAPDHRQIKSKFQSAINQGDFVDLPSTQPPVPICRFCQKPHVETSAALAIAQSRLVSLNIAATWYLGCMAFTFQNRG
jgi:hypothetical protein